MLRRSLATHVTPDHFTQAAISPTARPGQLTLTNWVRLTDASVS